MYMILNWAFMALQKVPAFVKLEFVWEIGRGRYMLHAMQENWESIQKKTKNAHKKV